ncbi:MAG: PKD domain-containing protein, partial [Flavobacteriales bacterium]
MAGDTNELGAFERSLKERLDQYEVPYNSADWAQMERALASGVRGWGHGRALVVGLLLAGGLLIGGTAYFLGRDGSTKELATSVPSSPEGIALIVPAPLEGSANSSAVSAPAASADQMIPLLPAASAAMNVPRSTTAQVNAVRPRKMTVPASTSTVPTSESGPSSNKPSSEGGAATMFRASAKEACPGSSVDFTVEHMPEDGIYLWNFGDGSFSNKPNPQHTFTKPGSYQVMLSMSSTGAGTIRNKPSSDMIVIHD